MTIKKLTVIMAAGTILLAGAIGIAIQLTRPDEMKIDLPQKENGAVVSVDGSQTTLTDMENIPLYYGETERLLLPLRNVMEGLGGTVEWDRQTKETKIAYKGKTLSLRAGEAEATLNGYEVLLPAEAESINGCLYGDAELLSAYFTDDISFDIDTGQVTLQAKDPSMPILAKGLLEEEGERSYRIEVPVFLGLNDSPYEKSLNASLRQELEAYAEACLEAAEEAGALHLRLEAGLADKDFFSLWWEGKADGERVHLTKNIDLMGQKAVDLSQMLTKESFAMVEEAAGEGWTAEDFSLTADGRLVLLHRGEGISLQYWNGEAQPLTWKQSYRELLEG
ncbi:MAG: copper amine oxidase N-terminal domain-containing protein [Bacillota bacterium]|nr:copper amine oxidase N-terminal domain-containing protein [Bacillota bacterium]